MATIRLEQVTKRYGELVAVDGVDMNVDAGEVLCLLGPSGCGKTTTLRMIAGLESTDSGSVYLDDLRVNDLAARERNIAMAFQFYALYPSLTVEQNLAYPLHAEALNASEIRSRVTETAKTLELDAILSRRPVELAEGEKQRVAVGRAIIRDPRCFLFDEPLSRLDVELRHAMRGQIKRVLSNLSKATVIVTHDQLEALTMADRIAVMRDGRIEQVSTPHAIFAEPVNEFVAGFIGTPQMNLMPVTVRHRDKDRVSLKVGVQDFVLAVEPQVALDDRFTIGIRPRAFSLRNNGNVNGDNDDDSGGDEVLHGAVDLIEPLGAETLLHVQADDLPLRVVVNRRERARVGDRVRLAIDPAQVHVFDSSGRRVDMRP